ncbi:MAG: aminotransferase class I/II-fold pyridoxal phosphate-dependent enzyme [Acidimicrobiia bacterium]|nr:aminotransferase class I/II-fold pyridoxal phosphate-dependent enzyme [Acidimicrobiia bacterium]MDX2467149.1 aminotransferase class I/II-fold pyridoxal phosphate-dependent enzyme [Acidimicrobiia bacterium]
MTGSFHMDPEEYRRRGHEMVDWVADYLGAVTEYPVNSQVEPGAIRAALPDAAPEDPEPFENVMHDLNDIIMPGITHWQSPNWFSYFPANSSGPSLLGEMAAAGLGVQGMLWSTSPAATELETVVVDWMADLLGLPESWKTTGVGGGVIQMSASDSAHVAMVTAREQFKEQAPLENLVVYASDQTHSSVEKGARVAGFSHVRIVATDSKYAMDPSALSEMIAADRAGGLTPAFIAVTVGTTATSSVDPVRSIAEIAKQNGMWVHVDAAYAGTTMICPEFRHHQDGIELADSYTFNPHKWMFTNFDCNLYYVADRKPLIDAMSILPPYLRNEATLSGNVIDYRDWHVPLGRRFRSLKLWFVLRHYGAAGIRHHIREHVRLANELAARLVADARFELVAPHPFALVVFRHADGNEATVSLAAALNASGKVSITPTTLGDTAAIRVSIGQTNTAAEHVDGLWAMMDELA